MEPVSEACTALDNAFLALEDPAALQAAADRLSPALMRERLDYRTLLLGPKFSAKERKQISGCFRTTPGADAFCVTHSYVATMRKQGRDLFHSLILTFQGQPPQPVLSG